MAVAYQNLDNSEQAKSEFLLAYPEFQSNPEFLKQMTYFFNTQPNSQDIVKQLLDKYLKLVPDDEDMIDLYNRII